MFLADLHEVLFLRQSHLKMNTTLHFVVSTGDVWWTCRYLGGFYGSKSDQVCDYHSMSFTDLAYT